MSDPRRIDQLRHCRDHQLRVARLHLVDGQRQLAADCVRRAFTYSRAMLALRRRARAA
ncbi:MAG TPA: hypothetical protein VGM87_25615 [Roseomonas sp.]|jgi:hypothetical protein